MGVAIKSTAVSQIIEDTATLYLTFTTFCHGSNSIYNPSISLYLLYFILPWLYLSSASLDTSTFYHRLLFFTVPYYTAFHKLNLATSFCHGFTLIDCIDTLMAPLHSTMALLHSAWLFNLLYHHSTWLQFSYTSLLDSMSLYLTLIHSTLALLHSTSLYFDSTPFYHGSTWL